VTGIDPEVRFREAVRAAWDRHNLGTYRNARQLIRQRTGAPGISTAVLHDMRMWGRIPTAEIVDRWADAIGESREAWQRLAGHIAPEKTWAPQELWKDVLHYLRRVHGLTEEEAMALCREMHTK